VFIHIYVDFPLPLPRREDFGVHVHAMLLVSSPLPLAPDMFQFLVRPFKTNHKSLRKYFIYFIHRAGVWEH